MDESSSICYRSGGNGGSNLSNQLTFVSQSLHKWRIPLRDRTLTTFPLAWLSVPTLELSCEKVLSLSHPWKVQLLHTTNPWDLIHAWTLLLHSGIAAYIWIFWIPTFLHRDNQQREDVLDMICGVSQIILCEGPPHLRVGFDRKGTRGSAESFTWSSQGGHG